MQKIFKVMSQWQISRIKSIISYIGVYTITNFEELNFVKSVRTAKFIVLKVFLLYSIDLPRLRNIYT